MSPSAAPTHMAFIVSFICCIYWSFDVVVVVDGGGGDNGGEYVAPFCSKGEKDLVCATVQQGGEDVRGGRGGGRWGVIEDCAMKEVVEGEKRFGNEAKAVMAC